MVLSEALKLFLLEQDYKGNMRRTLETYDYKINEFIKHVGDMAVEELNVKHFNEWHHHGKYKRKWSNSTMHSNFVHLKQYVKFLYRKSFIDYPLHDQLIVPKQTKTEQNPLTKQEIEIVLDFFNQKNLIQFRNYVIVWLILDTGLRKEDVENLKFENINFNGGYLHIMGKGAKQRTVPMGKKTQMLMQQYQYKRKPLNVYEQYFFLDEHGCRMSPEVIRMMFQKMKPKCGVPRICAKLLRHTFAVNYLIDGGDVKMLAQIMGHSSVKTTEIYLNLAAIRANIEVTRRQTYMDKLDRRY